MKRTGENGYGSHHKRLREQFRPIVESGQAVCPRCGVPIHPGALWDLGHDDNDRSKYVGPEHRRCNRGAPRRRSTSRRW